MTSLVNVVVTCTDRKKRSVNGLRLRKVPNLDVERRATRWWGKIGESTSKPIPAWDLYCGDHWSVVQSFREAGKKGGLRPQIWVCSAGYGLVPIESRLKPYSATFSSGHEDSVCRTGEELDDTSRAWWKTLSRRRGPANRGPRTIAGMAKQHPRTPIMVVASPPYLRAIEEDLLEAADELANREQLLVVSTGSNSNGDLRDYLLPADARLQRRLRGARQSLNARVAREVLLHAETYPIGSPDLKRHFKRKLAREDEIMRYDRKPMSDGEVIQFIKAQLQAEPKLKHSPLLTRLRASGRACEQKRFASLYRKIKEDENG